MNKLFINFKKSIKNNKQQKLSLKYWKESITGHQEHINHSRCSNKLSSFSWHE